MLIVPNGDRLTVEAKINPSDIDQVRPGQSATLRLTTFNQRTTPEIEGEVLNISPDLAADQRTGATYYTMRMAMKFGTRQLEPLHLVPGMPVETFVKTTQRIVLSYLTKPFADQLQRAFRER
jgi:HlyD family secretion protein